MHPHHLSIADMPCAPSLESLPCSRHKASSGSQTRWPMFLWLLGAWWDGEITTTSRGPMGHSTSVFMNPHPLQCPVVLPGLRWRQEEAEEKWAAWETLQLSSLGFSLSFSSSLNSGTGNH